jgi:hypothetical protein
LNGLDVTGAPLTVNNGVSDVFSVDDATGNTTIAGNVTLGSDATDNVTFNGLVASAIIPDANDTWSLGTTDNRWSDVWVSGGSIHIGETGDEGVLSYDAASDGIQIDKPLILPEIATGAITNPTTGQFTYNNGSIFIYDGTDWQTIPSSGSSNIWLNDNWLSNDGDDEGIKINNEGNVVIGAAPAEPDDDYRLLIQTTADDGGIKIVHPATVNTAVNPLYMQNFGYSHAAYIIAEGEAGSAMYLESNNDLNFEATLQIANSTASGSALSIALDEETSTANAVEIQAMGSGTALYVLGNDFSTGSVAKFQSSNSTNTEPVVAIESEGDNILLNIYNSNPLSSGSMINIQNVGNGDGLNIEQGGNSGRAIFLQTNTSDAAVLEAVRGNDQNVVADIWLNNVASEFSALRVKTEGVGMAIEIPDDGGAVKLSTPSVAPALVGNEYTIPDNVSAVHIDIATTEGPNIINLPTAYVKEGQFLYVTFENNDNGTDNYLHFNHGVSTVITTTFEGGAITFIYISGEWRVVSVFDSGS